MDKSTDVEEQTRNEQVRGKWRNKAVKLVGSKFVGTCKSTTQSEGGETGVGKAFVRRGRQ